MSPDRLVAPPGAREAVASAPRRPESRPERLTALAAIRRIADDGTWAPWPDPVGLADRIRSATAAGEARYAEELAAARAATGHDEAVVAGALRIGGVRAAILAWEFGFLGGSVGVGTAAQVVEAIQRATREGLPLLALPRSGGTRMQEGTPAFVQMVPIAAALAEHRAQGLPYLVHLCHPTTGGVLATVGASGDLVTAEPGAMVGFLGPRAVAAITGTPPGPGVQTAENLVAHGVLDQTLDWPELRAHWTTALALWSQARTRRPRPRPRPQPSSPPTPDGAAAQEGAPQSADELWAYVTASRAAHRPDAAEWIAATLTDRIVLPGTGDGALGSGVQVGLGRLADQPLVFAGTVDRRCGQPLTVGGLRTIRRGIALAEHWGLPVLTVVDTLGAQLSDAAEEAGIAGEISRVMLDLVSCPTPTVSLLLGAGTGGAAIALLAVDRIVAVSHAWVAPLPPEGAAAIRRQGEPDPPRVAWEQQIGAHALTRIGFVSRLVRESTPVWGEVAADALVDELADLGSGYDPERRVGRFAAWPAGGAR